MFRTVSIDAVLGDGAADIGGNALEPVGSVAHGDAEPDAAVLQPGRGFQNSGRDLLFLHIDQGAVDVEEDDFDLVYLIPSDDVCQEADSSYTIAYRGGKAKQKNHPESPDGISG